MEIEDKHDVETITWEWLGDSDWQLYDAETTSIIETAYQNAQTVVSLNHGFFGSGGGYTIDLIEMIQINDSTGGERSIRRNPPPPELDEKEVDASLGLFGYEGTPGLTSGEAPYWEWLSGLSWTKYDEETSNKIEGAYSLKEQYVDLTHGYFGKSGGYRIDLSRMKQIRNSTARERDIRRTPAAVPVAPPVSAPRSIYKPYVNVQPEMIRCDPSIFAELSNALNSLRKDIDAEEVYVEEINV
eukprot:TRINITY_DN9577_c0_g1_i1.p1 TRINITY_DN9577_c0_g1~~TRINITY_DN9577_c0_g1_i1.p1  ORF type:complete len:242 (-),score=37.13 TRINITY_DN9577_c0_g1_i1:215-940(-)